VRASDKVSLSWLVRTIWPSAASACGERGDGGVPFKRAKPSGETCTSPGKNHRKSGVSVLEESEPTRYAANERTTPTPTVERRSLAR
jgi:hypothetical protein